MIAGLWPEAERDRYVAAAARFRIPYWDWAAPPPSGQSVLPLSVGGSPYVDVNGPSGLQRISNPLFSYSFKPLNATAFAQRPVSTIKPVVGASPAYKVAIVEYLDEHTQESNDQRQ